MKKRTSDHALLSIAITAVLCAAVESSSNAPRLAAYRLDLNDHGNPSGFNPAQHLLLEFTPQEVRLGPPGKILALRLTGYGYGSRLHPPAPANPTVAGNRAEYHRRELTEWYLNEPPAVTQGFTLSQRPGDAHPGEPLILAVTVADGARPARPAITRQGDAVLLNPSGGSRLRYGELHSHDARGRELPSHLAVRGPQILLVVQDSGAEYPLVVEPTIASTLAEEAPPVDTAPGPYLVTTYAGGLPSPTATPATGYYLGPTGYQSPPQLTAVATDPFGNTYLASTLQCVFKVDSNGNITRVAGTCEGGYSGDGGPALSAQLNYPEGVAADAAGNLYIADQNNNRIRKVSSTGTITTIAGNGSAGFSGDNGPATSAQLNSPSGVALDSFGNLYIADQNNNRIRMVSPAGAITTVAGNGSPGYSADNVPATSSELNYPTGVAADSSGNLYIADTLNNRIREVSGGTITTVAGNGTYNHTGDGGPATSAELYNPQGVALDSNGTLYIADTDNNCIRAVSRGTITTVAGTTQNFSGDGGPATSAKLDDPGGVATDPAGNVYIADSANNRVRKFAPGGNISTIAGNGGDLFSGDGGLAISAQLSGPWGVAVDPSGTLYFADSNNNRIREISSGGTISTVLSGPPPPPTKSYTSGPAGLAMDSAGNLYIGDSGNDRVLKVGSGCAPFCVVAGVTGSSGYLGDNGPATAARIYAANGLAIDSAGNLYIADSVFQSSARVRKVSPSGTITTVAGIGTVGHTGDGGPGTAAEIASAFGLAVDSAGNLYIADADDSTVRKLSTDGTITTVAGHTLSYGYSGDGGPATSARLASPQGVAVDSAGDLFIADGENNTVRVVTPDGNINTIAGNGLMGYSGDGGPATSGEFGLFRGIALDSAGNLYVTDNDNNSIRKLQPVEAQPLLSIASTHTGNFTLGQDGATYTVTVSNGPRAGASSGTVTITEAVPAGLTLVSMAGSGWSCPGGNSCTRNDALSAGASYPITVTVNVASNAPSQVDNIASVSGGGSVAANTMDVTDIGGLQDLTVTKAHTGNFTQGQTGVTYTITVTNSGSAPTTGVVALDDSLPSGLTATALSGSGWNCTLGTLICTRSDGLASNSSYPSIALTANVAGNAPASVTNLATVSGGGEANTGNDQALDATTILGLPALGLTKTADAATVAAGAPIGYTLTVSNTGTGTATSAVLNDSLPSGTGISWSISPPYSGPGTCSIAGQTLSCSFGDLGSGASAKVRVTSATSASSCAAYANTATASSGSTGSVQASATTTVQCPTLNLTKTADAATVTAGASIGYTLAVSNTGAGTATSATLSDPLPSGTGIGWSISPAYTGPGACSIASQTLSCSFGDLASGATASVHVISATSASSCAAYSNTATLSASNSSPVQSSATTTVQCPSLSLTKTADAATVAAGSSIGYTLAVSNTGTGTATSATLSDTLPSGTGINWSISAAYSGPGTCSIAGHALSCNFGNLAAGATATVHVTSATSASSCAAYANTATLSAGNSSSVQASATTTVQCTGLSLTKTADAPLVAAGSSIGYTLAVNNTGAGTAISATLSDPLPTGTGIGWSISPAYNGPGACAIANQTLSCSFGNLVSGATATVHLTSATSTPSCAAYANTATLSASNSSSIQASATTTVQCPGLSLTKTADAAAVAPGSSIGYTLTAGNTGAASALSVSLSDPLPTGTGIAWSISPAYSGPGTCSITSQSLSCSFGNLASGATATVHVTSATSASNCAAFANTATLAASNSSSVQASATTTVQCPALSLTKTADTATVTAGASIGYTLAVNNTGSGTATAATLSDTLPAGTGINWSISPAYSGPGGCSIAGQTLSCNFGNLASGATASVHVTSTTSASSCAAYANTATLSASNSSSVQASATTTVQCPALNLTKTADAATVSAGSSIGYTLAASNTGAGTALSVSLSDPLPTGTGIGWSIGTAYNGPGTCSVANQTLSCTFGSLASGATATVHVTSGTSASSCAAYANTATLSASNSSSVQASATTTVQCPALGLTKTADAATVAAGASIGYTLAVSNTGSGTATAATLSDTLPTGTGIGWSISPPYSGPGTCSISSQALSCNFGNLASGAAGTVHVVSGSSASSCAAYANTATLSASNSSSVQASATTTVQCPALSLTKTADAAGVAPGASIGYTLAVGNAGSGTATAAMLSDTLPSGTGISWSISPAYSGPGTCSIAGQALSCNFGNLAAGATATVHVTSGTSTSSCGLYANSATLSATNSSSVQSSATTTVQCPSLSLTKTADAVTVAAGASIGYTLAVSNTGTGIATSATLNDTLPTGTGITWSISPAYTGPGTCAIASQTLSCNFGNLASGATASVHVASGTSTSNCAAYTNTATLSATNSSSVQSSATTTVQCPALSLTKTADAATVAAGASIGYTLAVTNTGAGTATSATLTDTLPTGTGITWSINPAYTGPGTCAIASQTLSCNFGNLASGATASVHVASGTSTSSCAAYTNTASLSATNSSSVQSSATTTVQCPALSLTKTADAATVAAGASIGYTLAVSNTGTGIATSATLSDTLPTGTGITWSISPAYTGPGTCSIASQTLSCNFGNLASGATASVHVASGTSTSNCAAYANTATLNASNSSSVQSSATTTVQCPALSLTKTADAATVAAGASIGYTLAVSNTGTGIATSATLSDTLPAGTGITWSISPAYTGSGTCSIASQTLSCNFGNLASGATATVHVASATSTSSCAAYTNTATLSATNSSSVQSSATTTVQCPALSLTKTADAATVAAGAPIGYTLAVNNTGTGIATSATLTDTLPTGTGITWSISPAYTGPGTCAIASQTLSCNFGNLASGATATVHVISGTSTSSCAAYTNTATLSASNSSSVQSSATTTVQCPALSLTKTADAATVAAGASIGYTLAVNNTGTGIATSATLNDTLPTGAGITWSINPAYTGPGTCAIASQTLSCNFGNLASGATASVRVTSGTSTSSCAAYTNTATLSASNSSSVQSSATTTVQCPALSLTKTADAATVAAGASIGYTLAVTNTGAGTATSATLTDTLPAGTGITWSISPAYTGSGTCSIASQTLSCNFGNLASGATATVHVASATSTSSCAAYTNTASLSATNSSSVQSSATTTVQCPALSLTKTADAATVEAGAAIGYTLAVANTGAGTATSATLSDTLPTGTGITWSISPAYNGPGTCSLNGQLLSCNLGNLASGSTASVHVTSTTSTSSCASYANTATLSAGNSSSIQASATATVLCPDLTPALNLTQTADAATVAAGSSIGYTLAASNKGSGAAISASLSDSLPSGTGVGWTISPPYTGPGACLIASGALSCNLGSFAANATATVHVTGTTSTSSCGAYANSATLSAPGVSSAQATAATTVVCPSLSIQETHQGAAFTQGQPGVLYFISVGNSSSIAPTSGRITVTETVPAGLSLVSLAGAPGSGWTCPAAGTTCLRSDSLSPGTTYPAITVTMNVAAAAPSQVTNQATVSGGGSANAGTGDPTTILPFTCAITGDLVTSIVDVQAIINEALGVTPAGDDLTHDGVVNVADIQKVINSVLQSGCPY